MIKNFILILTTILMITACQQPAQKEITVAEAISNDKIAETVKLVADKL